MSHHRLYPRFAAAVSRVRLARGTVRDACRDLAASGYEFQPDEWIHIEQGILLPQDAGRLLAAIKEAFNLSESTERNLVLRLAYDILERELGEDYASAML